jgi:hypothetical protein
MSTAVVVALICPKAQPRPHLRSGSPGSILPIIRPGTVKAEAVDLTALVESVVESQRHRTGSRGVRLSCGLLDDAMVLGCELDIAARIEAMLFVARRDAVANTRVQCIVRQERGEATVRLRFLSPAPPSGGSKWEVAGAEVSACWPLAEDRPAMP